MTPSSDEPLVTVVLPTYDRPELLPESIATVTNQTYDKIELVVVDDHSPESPRDIVENVSREGLHDVVFVRHTENKGASAARNTGIETAQGELIAFLDDDDTWKPTKIERQIDAFRKVPSSVGVVYTGIRSATTDDTTINVRHVDREGDLTKEILCGFTPPFSSVVVRREVVADAGPFDEDLPSWNDREWLLRVSQHCDFTVVDAPLVVSRRGNDHTNLSGDLTLKREESYPKVVEKFRPVAAEYGRLFARKSHAHLTFRLGYAALANEEYEAARRIFFIALSRWPFAPKFFVYALVAMAGDRGYKTARSLKQKTERLRLE